MRTSTGRCVGMVSALALLLAGTSIISPAQADDTPNQAAHPGQVTSTALAGILTGWGGTGGMGDLSVPDSLDGLAVTSVSMGSGWALASTVTGKVITWGADGIIAPALPSSLDPSTLTQLSAAGTSAAAAVTTDGRVTTWLGGGTSAAGAWLDTSALTDVTLIAVGQQAPYGVALTRARTIKTWGVDTGGVVSSTVPGTLTGVQDIAACDDTALAVTADGGVVGWGADTAGLVSDAPAPPTDTHMKVNEIACTGNTAIALRLDGTITEWGEISGANAVPPSLTAAIADNAASTDGATVNSIAASNGSIVARNTKGELWAWGSAALAADGVPAELTGVPVSELAPGNGAVYALTPAVIALDKPAISGTAVVGRTLSATDATFSGGPTVAGQWYRDGVPIDGATTTLYRVTGSDSAAALSYRSIATKPGYASATAESDPVTAGRAASAVAVSARPGSYGHTTSATVTVTSPGAVSGPVTISVDGARAGTATLAKGSATITLPATLAAGIHMIGATYAGNVTSGGAAGWTTLTLTKATSTARLTLPKKARRGKKVKAIVTVATSGGRATGGVTVKIGKAKGVGTLINGKAAVKVKLAKPTKARKQKATVIYAGDTNVRGCRAHAKLTVK